MEPFNEFLALTLVTIGGVWSIIVRKKTKEAHEPQLDFIDWLILSFPPLVPLVTVFKNEGIDLGWYLLAYLSVMVTIFGIWFYTKKSDQRKRNAYPSVISVLICWIIIGFAIFYLTIN